MRTLRGYLWNIMSRLFWRALTIMFTLRNTFLSLMYMYLFGPIVGLLCIYT